MGTITERKRQDGSSAFTAQIRLRIDGQPHSEARTFNRRKPAEVWLTQREAELAKGLPKPDLPIPIGELIHRFLEAPDLSRSKRAELNAILSDDLAKVNAKVCTAADLIAYVRRRRNRQGYRKQSPIQAATVLHDLYNLRQCFLVARTEWSYDLDLKPLEDALVYCRNQRLVGHSPKRERRLTPEEETMLMNHFAASTGDLPMTEIIQFAIHSTRRLGEICRIRWEDFDAHKKVIRVRDVKHPRHKIGNHRQSRLTDEAMAIIQRQPKTNDRIFPYHGSSITSSFYRACHLLGIENLHFHDLRHEAISRLFEKGYQIHEVALFSLHQSWEHLKRYTHLKAEDIRDI